MNNYRHFIFIKYIYILKCLSLNRYQTINTHYTYKDIEISQFLSIQYFALKNELHQSDLRMIQPASSIQHLTFIIRVCIINVNNQLSTQFQTFGPQLCVSKLYSGFSSITYLLFYSTFMIMQGEQKPSTEVDQYDYDERKKPEERKCEERKGRCGGGTFDAKESDLSKAIALQGCLCNQTLTLLGPQQSIDTVQCSR